MEERREFARVKTDRACTLKLSVSGSTTMKEIPAKMMDISGGGCKLQTDDSLGDIQVIYMDVIFDDAKEKEIRETSAFIKTDLEKRLQSITRTFVIKLIRESQEGDYFYYNCQFINLSADLEKEVFAYVNKRNMVIRRSQNK